MITLRAAARAVMARNWDLPPRALADLRALVDEALRIADLLDGADILESNERTDGRRQWVEIGTYLQPGDVVAVLDDWRQESET